MTRLLSADICHIARNLEDYNRELVAKTGCTLSQIAAHAVAGSESDIRCSAARVAVIPLTCGLGVIEGFARSVESIVNFLGFSAFVTDASDAGGVAEAVAKGAGVLMMADDNRFVAVNLTTGKVADNSEATGKGFAAALKLMAGGIKGKKVLIVGAGPVGRGAALALAGSGAVISVYDINRAAGVKLAREVKTKYGCGVNVETDPDSALCAHQIIFDASPAGGFIEMRHVTGETYIVAPGMPPGVNDECLSMVSARLLHDPLQIGVATMIFDVLKQQEDWS